jgi:hypothetical protein
MPLYKIHFGRSSSAALSIHWSAGSALRRVFKVAIDRNWIHGYQVPELKNNGEKGKRRPYFTVQEYREMARFLRSWSKTGSVCRQLNQDQSCKTVRDTFGL